ncbi:MAG: bi-domain-containing oxidoreductase [Patescibacteria group bacterium]|nr:bi-domain-containing oxidoreductase [Patescibacteria group bacterium]MDD5221729.1 bi-domain-containing oxidoreductase [Patescibacteria group bacterium]MDD5395782.1 bi-domain-containing oxidoreductase [Patescibacteria group bacterium]
MKQISLDLKNGEIEVVDVPTPSIRSGGVLVRNLFSLISVGTEKSAVQLAQKSLIAKGRSRPDLVKQVMNKIKTDGLVATIKTVKQKLNEHMPLGYSCAGEVVSVGEGAEEFKIGDLVACAGGGYAAHAEFVFIPKNLCAKIPNNISTQEAAFTTVAAIALEGVRVLNLTAGETVGVIGLGLIGQITCQILRAYGHPVIGFDLNAQQVNRAIDLGLKNGVVIGAGDPLIASNNFTNNLGLDAVIITAATKSNQPIELAGEIVHKKGKISVVGDVLIDIPRKIYYEKEIQLTVSCSYGPGRYDNNYEDAGIDYPLPYVRWTEKRNLQEILRLLAEGKINIKSLVTHVFDINKAQDAYNLVLHPGGEEIVGILLKYLPEAKITPTIIYQKEPQKFQSINQIKVGLIGVGNFAKAMILPSLSKIKKAVLWAVADTSGQEAATVIKKFNGKYATTDYRRIIDDPDVNLVVVSTRHDLHAQIVIEALKKNKNVHIEKPLALTEQELEKIMAVAKESKGRLMVGFNRRFAPQIMLAKKMFTQSPPLMIYARMNAGYIPKEHWVHDLKQGGRIIGEACHLIDLIRFLTGSRPTDVYATSVPLGGNVQNQDNVFISINFANGSRGCVLYTSLGNKNAPKESIEIFGDNQTMIIDNFRSALLYTAAGVKKQKLFSQDKGHFNEFKTFIEAIYQGLPSPIPLNELFESSSVTLKVLESLRENKPIHLV